MVFPVSNPRTASKSIVSPFPWFMDWLSPVWFIITIFDQVPVLSQSSDMPCLPWSSKDSPLPWLPLSQLNVLCLSQSLHRLDTCLQLCIGSPLPYLPSQPVVNLSLLHIVRKLTLIICFGQPANCPYDPCLPLSIHWLLSAVHCQVSKFPCRSLYRLSPACRPLIVASWVLPASVSPLNAFC